MHNCEHGQSGLRPDAVNLATREVVELKPNTAGAIASGLRQVAEYARQSGGGIPRCAVQLSRRDLRTTVTQLNAVQSGFDRFGRTTGLQKRSGAWYRLCDEVIAVVDLQKSQYGPQYYVNLGFWLRQLGDEVYLRRERCHISVRLEVLLASERRRVARLFDLDEDIPEEGRASEIVRVLSEQIVPLLDEGCTLNGLRSLVADGTLRGAAIRGAAQQILADLPNRNGPSGRG